MVRHDAGAIPVLRDRTEHLSLARRRDIRPREDLDSRLLDDGGTPDRALMTGVDSTCGAPRKDPSMRCSTRRMLPELTTPQHRDQRGQHSHRYDVHEWVGGREGHGIARI